MIIVLVIVAIILVLAFGVLGVAGIAALAFIGWLIWLVAPVFLFLLFCIASFIFLAIAHAIRPADFQSPWSAIAEGWRAEDARRARTAGRS